MQQLFSGLRSTFSFQTTSFFCSSYSHFFQGINTSFLKFFDRFERIRSYFFHCAGLSVHHLFNGPVDWDCRIRRLHIHRGERPLHPTCPGYGTKPSDSEASHLNLWEMWSSPPLPLLQFQSDSSRIPSIGQMKLFSDLTVCK